MDWIDEINKLKDGNIYDVARLLIDGKEVDYTNQIVKRKVFICWYVDQVFKGEWLIKENETGQKFGKPIYTIYTSMEYQFSLMLNGKKKADAIKKAYVPKFIGYHYRWNNTAELIRFLKSKNYDITVRST